MKNRHSRYITIGDFNIHYSEWGKQESPTIICVHGLTRNGRDFDLLASELSSDYHVICPDVIGRGLSDWSPEPNRDYHLSVYEAQLVAMLDKLMIEKMIWIGTSMGGAMGIRLAGTVLKERITHLILNDIGAGPTAEMLKNPAVSAEGINHIIEYTANPPSFKSLNGLIGYYKETYAGFGIQSEEEWIAFTEHSVRRTENGAFSPDYDPNIVTQFNDPYDLFIWDQWDRTVARTLILRGEHSPILAKATAEEMAKRGPGCQLVEWKGLGHAPALNTKDQIETIKRFIKK
ncbi:alpha/beta fold hydrolase [Camelliibacillus cellulosilyticus]|uniref:Alpha/beta fold hydrolase n=1 Tax=Camelliibacillus cellulosilyticus TaxID=2174486 RepID=A0ABV9GUZ8_9BACL